jgi:tetratricopeptide (TPR) repeat protein
MAKNIGFLLKNVPSAANKAEKHFNQAIEITEEIGAKSYAALAYLELGLLHRAKKRADPAKKCISRAIELFEQCEAEVYLKQAREALATLN